MVETIAPAGETVGVESKQAAAPTSELEAVPTSEPSPAQIIIIQGEPLEEIIERAGFKMECYI